MPKDDKNTRPSDLKFLKVPEVAQTMRVSKMTVYRLIDRGELRATKVGRQFRVPEPAVHEYLKNGYVTKNSGSTS